MRADVEVMAKSTYVIDWENRMGSTALILACVEADLAVVDELIKRKAILDHENRMGHTALPWAVICGHDEVRRDMSGNLSL